jgi:hypothetical protein
MQEIAGKLKEASKTGSIPSKWGGIFGQELVVKGPNSSDIMDEKVRIFARVHLHTLIHLTLTLLETRE